MGDAKDNAQVQCGGWTLDWNNSPSTNIPGVTTILDGFYSLEKKTIFRLLPMNQRQMKQMLSF